MKFLAPVSLTVVALAAFTFLGCGSHSMDSAGVSNTPTANTPDDEHSEHEHSEHEHSEHEHSEHEHGEHGDHEHGEHGDHDHAQHGGAQTAMEKMKIELAKLSPEDAASAMKQHFCPVTGEMLGVMGAPKKIDVNGQSVWICCDACKDKLLANPDKFLAKLNK